MSKIMFTLVTIVCTVFLLTNGATIPGSQPTSEMTEVVQCEKRRFPYLMADLKSGQCDSYIRCENGVMTSELCEDGFVYNPRDNMCDLPHRVDCVGRERLQPPKGSGNCPRLNGLYPHKQFCDQYYYCRLAMPLLVTCPPGLIYDLKQGVCKFPDEALRPGCMPEEVLGFVCPPHTNATELTFGDHLRYPKPGDCRYFFKCLKNGHPRLGGCEQGEVFNPASGVCDLPENVKGCEKYYEGKE